MPKVLTKETHEMQKYNGIVFSRPINTKGHFRNHKYGYIHRYVWSDIMETGVPDGCVIHHVDQDKSNNDISNIVCMEKKEHDRWHANNMSLETKNKISKKITKYWEKVKANKGVRP